MWPHQPPPPEQQQPRPGQAPLLVPSSLAVGPPVYPYQPQSITPQQSSPMTTIAQPSQAWSMQPNTITMPTSSSYQYAPMQSHISINTGQQPHQQLSYMYAPQPHTQYQLQQQPQHMQSLQQPIYHYPYDVRQAQQLWPQTAYQQPMTIVPTTTAPTQFVTPQSMIYARVPPFQVQLQPPSQMVLSSPMTEPLISSAGQWSPTEMSLTAEGEMSAGAESVQTLKRQRSSSPSLMSGGVIRPVPKPSPSPPAMHIHNHPAITMPIPHRIQQTSMPPLQHLQTHSQLHHQPMTVDTPRQSAPSSAFVTHQSPSISAAQPQTYSAFSSATSTTTPEEHSVGSQQVPVMMTSSDIVKSTTPSLISSGSGIQPWLTFKAMTSTSSSIVALQPSHIPLNPAAPSTISTNVAIPSAIAATPSPLDMESASGSQSPSSSSESSIPKSLSSTIQSLTRSLSTPTLASASSTVLPAVSSSPLTLTPPLSGRMSRQCRHVCGCRQLSSSLTLSRLRHHEENPRVHARCDASKPCYIYLKHDTFEGRSASETQSLPPSPLLSGRSSSTVSSESTVQHQHQSQTAFELVRCRHTCGCRAMISSNNKTRTYHESSMSLHINCRPLTVQVGRSQIASTGGVTGLVADGCPLYDRLYNPSQQNLRTLIYTTRSNQTANQIVLTPAASLDVASTANSRTSTSTSTSTNSSSSSSSTDSSSLGGDRRE